MTEGPASSAVDFVDYDVVPAGASLAEVRMLSDDNSDGGTNATAQNSNSTSTGTAVVVGWSPIYVTLLISFAQGLILFLFFLRARATESKGEKYDIYERRVFNRSHRTPPPYSGGGGMFGWARAAWSIDSDELLRCVGLDSYMYLRFLRLGFRCAAFGSFLGCLILMPVYYTGGAEGPETEAFNSITLANVPSSSPRLWSSLVCWVLFVAFVLRMIWIEWVHYADRRSEFLAKGDADTDPDYRYAILVEGLPRELRGNDALRSYFERLFPGKVRQANVCLDTSSLDNLIAERQKFILQYEKADAFVHAKPDKPKPQIRVDGIGPLPCFGRKVEALPYLANRIKKLTKKIERERSALCRRADTWSQDPAEAWARSQQGRSAGASALLSKVKGSSGSGGKGGSNGKKGENLSSFHDEETQKQQNRSQRGSSSSAAVDNAEMSSTAFVTFTSLRSKQCAVQCELSGNFGKTVPSAAPEPNGVLWRNVPVEASRQRYVQMLVACFWTTGFLFWAIPVSFVTSIANLNGILGAVGLPLMDESSFAYGFIAGLLPVIFLQILMIVLYLSIEASAARIVRKKSMAEVDGYTFFWHQLYQFANLWLIVLGGSLFNQMDALLNDPGSVATLLASAMPGSSTFFVNMISAGSFGAFGMELSQVVAYVVRAIMNCLIPVAGRTQRTLDAGTEAQSIKWGKQIPPNVFIFLVMLVYMTITPLVEPFAMVFFGGSYVVWRHQCLHVYAQEFEGGGKPVWENLSSFLFVSLYTAEAIFFAYMGIKKGAGQATCGLVCLGMTVLVHVRLIRTVMRPLRNLALEVAARVDIDEGELEVDDVKPAKKAERETSWTGGEDGDGGGGGDEEVGVELALPPPEEPKASSLSGEPYARAVERQLYGQPSLKRSQDENRPMPYRRRSTKGVGTSRGKDEHSA